MPKWVCLSTARKQCMAVSKQAIVPACKIFMDAMKIQQVNQYNYLGILLTTDGKCDTEIRRIGMAMDSFRIMDKILLNCNISTTKLIVLNC